jgi:hypothetical protein
LFYPKGRGEEPILVGYSDSDLAGDVDGRKNTSGLIFFLGDCPISSHSAKQRIVVVSSCEAEYIAVVSSSCQAVWLAMLLSEILNKDVERAELRTNNK